MYRRYFAVGIVFFLLIGAYFIFFFEKKDKSYEKYYNKLVSRETFEDSLNGVNIDVEEIDEGNSKYTYIITFDGVSDKQSNVKILVLDEMCSKKKIEQFPSFGIVANKGYSLVKNGEENEEKKLIKGVNLTVINKEKIDYFIIYFASNNKEQFVKVNVGTFLD